MDVAVKRWIGAQELYEDSLRLALMVLDSGFAPTLLLGLWRGGAPVAITVQETLAYFGVHAEHLCGDALIGNALHLFDQFELPAMEQLFRIGRSAQPGIECKSRQHAARRCR